MSCRVSLPLAILEDPAFSALQGAFHPGTIEPLLLALAAEQGRGSARSSALGARLIAIDVIRHKTGRRCVVEYQLGQTGAVGPVGEPTALMGKIRAKGPDRRTFDLLRTLWQQGFDGEAADGVSIPAPLGLIPSLHMGVQAKASGEPVDGLLAVPYVLQVAQRVAQAAGKIHRLPLSPTKVHRAAEELHILRDRFDQLLITHPHLGRRLAAVHAACSRLLGGLEEARLTCVHRDFYPAQILVDGSRITLLDFDLFCLGDPALDVGNFLGHVTEQSIRDHGHAGGYSYFELLFKESYLELAGPDLRPRIRAYQTLTMARHIFLCTLKPERSAFLEDILGWCEERLDLRPAARSLVAPGHPSPGKRNSRPSPLPIPGTLRGQAS